MEREQAQMGLEKPPVQYVDGAYISAQQLVAAQAEGRELIGPAPAAMQRDGRFGTEDFQVQVEARQALCPAGKTNTQCSRLVEAATGKVSYRFEFGAPCHACPLRDRCVGKGQRHRTLVVGEYYTALQARRQEQATPAFKARMKHRNAIEGTQSELVRAHGLRRARYRGLGKVKLQNYFMGAACNVKRWLRREAWKLRQAVSVSTAEVAGRQRSEAKAGRAPPEDTAQRRARPQPPDFSAGGFVLLLAPRQVIGIKPTATNSRQKTLLKNPSLFSRIFSMD